MAKRKRLSPAVMAGGEGPEGLETKAHNGWVGVRARAPIAEVAGDAAAQSAFEEVAGELQAARAEGRMVVRLALSAIDPTYLVRDRLAVDPDDMAALKDSLRARGQQTPIEVTDLGAGRYGLISGWRRLAALQALADGTDEGARFGFVQALVRSPDTVADAYCAMVEENEIRADLSFYERARIALKSVEQGIYPDTKTAVQSLFSAARGPKRSKIISFTALVRALDGDLRFPAAIPEKLGLRLAQALEADPGLRPALGAALAKAAPQDAAAERAVLDGALRPAGPRSGRRPEAEEIRPGVVLTQKGRSVTLSGPRVDGQLLDDLRDWLRARRG